MESKRFRIPSLPPSCNAIYNVIFSQRRVEMKPEVRLWKTQAKECIPKISPLNGSYLFELKVEFYYNFFYKNGKLRKFDSQNLLKILCDAVAEKCGFNDSLIKFGAWESYHTTEEGLEYIEVELRQVTNEQSPQPLKLAS